MVSGDRATIKQTMLAATGRALRAHPGGVPSLRIFGDKDASRGLSELTMAGERVGGAVISSKDPNFIINDQDATSHDVYELAQRMKNRVKVRLGQTLHEAVSWRGEW